LVVVELLATRYWGESALKSGMRAGLAMSAAALLGACSSYDASALNQRLENYYARTAAEDAGAPEEDAAAPDEPPVEPEERARYCGDGRVSVWEECDTGIPEGWPGACPTSCPEHAACARSFLVGYGCQAECVVIPPLCVDGDGCCPSYCTYANDSDCSRSCGNGVVEADKGETCEPGHESTPCPSEADCDDGDPCTQDLFTGSAENCSARCLHVPITALETGDACCPTGANANTDGDCASECGNGVREPGEECDGVLGCDQSCKLTLNEAQLTCLSLVEESGNACDRCACEQCAEQQLDCLASGNAVRDAHCAEITQCANDNDCTGSACYCRDLWCIYDGPCRAVIDSAVAADPSGASVTVQTNDPNTAVGRASLVGQCKMTHCSDVCP
jgi:hypothetical protein